MSHDTESTTHPATRLDDDDPVPGQDNPAHDTTLLPSGIESPDANESANRCSQSPGAYVPYDAVQGCGARGTSRAGAAFNEPELTGPDDEPTTVGARTRFAFLNPDRGGARLARGRVPIQHRSPTGVVAPRITTETDNNTQRVACDSRAAPHTMNEEMEEPRILEQEEAPPALAASARRDDEAAGGSPRSDSGDGTDSASSDGVRAVREPDDIGDAVEAARAGGPSRRTAMTPPDHRGGDESAHRVSEREDRARHDRAAAERAGGLDLAPTGRAGRDLDGAGNLAEYGRRDSQRCIAGVYGGSRRQAVEPEGGGTGAVNPTPGDGRRQFVSTGRIDRLHREGSVVADSGASEAVLMMGPSRVDPFDAVSDIRRPTVGTNSVGAKVWTPVSGVGASRTGRAASPAGEDQSTQSERRAWGDSSEDSDDQESDVCQGARDRHHAHKWNEEEARRRDYTARVVEEELRRQALQREEYRKRERDATRERGVASVAAERRNAVANEEAVRDRAEQQQHPKRRSPLTNPGRQRAETIAKRIQGMIDKQNLLLNAIPGMLRTEADQFASNLARVGLDHLNALELVRVTHERYGPLVASAAMTRFSREVGLMPPIEVESIDCGGMWAQLVAGAVLAQGGSAQQGEQQNTPRRVGSSRRREGLSQSWSGDPGCGSVESMAQEMAVEALSRTSGVTRAAAEEMLRGRRVATPSGDGVCAAIAAAGTAPATTPQSRGPAFEFTATGLQPAVQSLPYLGFNVGSEGAVASPTTTAEPVVHGVVKVSSTRMQVTLVSGSVSIEWPGWYTGDLKPGLRFASMRQPRAFCEVVARVPLGGYRLRQMVERPVTAKDIASFFPMTHHDSNGYSVARAPLLEELLGYWVSVIYDSVPQDVAEGAASDIAKRLVQALCLHPLFKNRSSMLRTLLSASTASEAILQAFHIADEVYVTPVVYAAASGAHRFDHRVWMIGESASEFVASLIDLGRLENKESIKIWEVFGARCVERQNDGTVLNGEVVNAVCDRFVNLRMAEEVVDLEGLKMQLRFDTMGITRLTARQTRSVPPRGQVAQALTVTELQELAAMHNLSLVTCDETDEQYGHNDGSGQVLYGAGDGARRPAEGRKPRGKLVAGPADLQLWAKLGLCSQQTADESTWNHSRSDGMFGKDCPGCGGIGADGKPVFTDEATFRELREANGGVPPYAQKGQPQKPPPAGTVVVHHKNLCFGWWFMAVKKVESGEVDPAALVPMDKEAFEALLAADKAKGAKGK